MVELSEEALLVSAALTDLRFEGQPLLSPATFKVTVETLKSLLDILNEDKTIVVDSAGKITLK